MPLPYDPRLPSKIAMIFAATLACVRTPPSGVPSEPAPPSGALVQPDARAPGDRFELDRLPLADGGVLTLTEAAGIGPVILLWFGGAEHAELLAWVRELADGVASLEARGATLVIVRPLPPERADVFAAELGLQVVVAADERGDLGRAAGWVEPLPEWALLVIDGESSVRYHAFTDPRPTLAELLEVVDATID